MACSFSVPTTTGNSNSLPLRVSRAAWVIAGSFFKAVLMRIAPRFNANGSPGGRRRTKPIKCTGRPAGIQLATHPAIFQAIARHGKPPAKSQLLSAAGS